MRMMASFTTIPMSEMKPILNASERGLPVRYRPIVAPIKAIKMAYKMKKGILKLLNWSSNMMDMRNNAVTRPMANELFTSSFS